MRVDRAKQKFGTAANNSTFNGKDGFLWPRRTQNMESLIVKIFQVVFKLVVTLMISGTLVTALMDLQKVAFQSRRTGLLSMLKVNQQLVGKIK